MNENTSALFGPYRTLNLIMLWLFTLTLLLLLLPYSELAPALAAKIEAHRSLLITALIVSISNFIAQFIGGICWRAAQKKVRRHQEQHMQQAVERLDFAERALLREFVLQRKSVLALPLTEPTVRSLLDSGLLQVLNVPQDSNGKYQFAIAKAARPYITYRAIGLSRSKMSEEAISQILAARPDYARVKTTPQRAYRGVRAA